MIIQPTDGTQERRVLIASITSTEFLSKSAGKVGNGPFRSDTGNLIWSWCENHYARYRTCPGKVIESIFSDHCKVNSDKEKNQAISRVLSILSGQYESYDKSQLEYDIDQAERFFNEVKLGRHAEEVSLLLSKGQYTEAMSLQKSFEPVDLHTPPFVDLLRDKEKQRKSLEARARVLVRFRDDAEIFFGDEFAEESMIGIMAPAKGKKSYTLLHIAWLGVVQGRKVAYFQVGDLSESQIYCRFLRRAAYRPIKAGNYSYPIQMTLGEEEGRVVPIVERDVRTYESGLTWKVAEMAWEHALNKYKGELRLSTHPTRTISMSDIRRIVRSWDRDGWRADLVVIDYAGNLAPNDVKMAPYQQTDYSWGMMKQLSEERKCCVVTANQSNKESFSTWVLTRKHFSDSKMILAHCTAFIGVNVTDEEAEQSVVRYNFVVRREGRFSETECLYCASWLEAANPMVLTALPERRKP